MDRQDWWFSFSNDYWEDSSWFVGFVGERMKIHDEVGGYLIVGSSFSARFAYSRMQD